jgi:hypothetical protein
MPTVTTTVAARSLAANSLSSTAPPPPPPPPEQVVFVATEGPPPPPPPAPCTRTRTRVALAGRVHVPELVNTWTTGTSSLLPKAACVSLMTAAVAASMPPGSPFAPAVPVTAPSSACPRISATCATALARMFPVFGIGSSSQSSGIGTQLRSDTECPGRI